MSGYTTGKSLDPANRLTAENVPNTSSKLLNEATSVTKLDGKILEVAEKDISETYLVAEKNKRKSRCRKNQSDGRNKEDGHSESSSISSTSSGSIGDVPISPNKRITSIEPSYLSSVDDANLPLEVISPILDLVDDDDDDAFGEPLSQQDEKLLEELLRFVTNKISITIFVFV